MGVNNGTEAERGQMKPISWITSVRAGSVSRANYRWNDARVRDTLHYNTTKGLPRVVITKEDKIALL